MQQIEQMFEKDNTKFAKIRSALAHKNQEIALLSRKMDDIPTRTELIQYEKSFVELYEQVSRIIPVVTVSILNTHPSSEEYT